MTSINDVMPHIGPELRDDELDAVSGGRVAEKARLRAAQGSFEDFVTDAVVSAGEVATVHSMK
jgi:hypothetical protein